MSLTKVKNPVDKEITLNYQGTIYNIGPKESKEFPEAVAQHWVTIYEFMSLTKGKEEVDEVKEVEEVVKKKVTKK